MSRASVVVVGASLGGLRAAEQLRAAGHTGPITVLGDEPWLPYNRPPLSKDVLFGAGDEDPASWHASVALRRRGSVDDVDFVLGRRAVSADLDAQTVTLDDGAILSYDGLVVATGLRPRTLDVPGPAVGRHVLRTLEHACGLRAAIASREAAVVVGSGFVGCETAASLRKLGRSVTVVHPETVALQRALGTVVGGAVQRHLEAAGVAFVDSATVAGYEGDDEVSAVLLADGRRLPTEVVVEAVGSACNVEWLVGNGLDLTDGVLCDNDLRVVGARRVVAVGDVARFPNPLFADESGAAPRRVEHWSMPTDTAKRAAASLTAQIHSAPGLPAEPFAPTPSFWSDLLDLRLQAYGLPSLADEHRVDEGDIDNLTDGAVVSYYRRGRRIGVLAVNVAPARMRSLRDRLVARPATL